MTDFMKNEQQPVTSPMLAPGTTLQGGKYRIEYVLGQGGFGITYLATMTMLNQKVAIKEFFFKEFCERNSADSTVMVNTQSKKDLVGRFQKKFLKEAKIIFGLRHENIIKLLDVFEENNTSYYAMEYIEGRSLAEEIKLNGPLDRGKAIYVLNSVCSALGYIHSQKINHLDIKPNNIMLDKNENRVMLIDFGVSKQYDPNTGDCTTTTPVGISEGYSPLEQYNLGGVNSFSPQTDIYALGATTYKIITGKTPPTAIDVSQNGLPPFPADVPVPFIEAIKKAMQPVPANRPQTVAEFWNLLNGEDDESTVFDDEPSPVVPNSERPSTSQSSPRAPIPPISQAPSPQVPPAAPHVGGTSVSGKRNILRTVLIVVISTFVLVFVALLIIGYSASDESGTKTETNGDDTEIRLDETPARIPEGVSGISKSGSFSNTNDSDISQYTPHEFLVTFSGELNASCPSSILEGMTLQTVKYDDHSFNFVLEIDEERFSADEINMAMTEYQNAILESLFVESRNESILEAFLSENVNLCFVYWLTNSDEPIVHMYTSEELEQYL